MAHPALTRALREIPAVRTAVFDGRGTLTVVVEVGSAFEARLGFDDGGAVEEAVKDILDGRFVFVDGGPLSGPGLEALETWTYSRS